MNSVPGASSPHSAGKLTSSAGTINAWVKVSKTYLDFSVAATTKQITIYTLPIGSILFAIKAKHSTAFSGGGATRVDLRCGLSGTTLFEKGRFLPLLDVYQATGAEVYTYSVPQRGNSHTATTDVTATIDADVNLNTLAAGAVDFWFLYFTAV